MQRKHKLLALSALALVGVVPAYQWKQSWVEDREESVANYQLNFSKPAGWIEKEKHPQHLFNYENSDGVRLKGAHTQIVSEVNPTPELDRDGLTRQFAQVTRDNLGWKATIQEVVSFDGGTYRLIRRETVDRTIVTAIAVRGNTTILVTLAGVGASKSHIDETLPEFKSFLKKTSFSSLHYDD